MTIGDNIVETMSVNKTIHTPPPLSFKVVLLGCLLLSTGSLNSSTTLHGGGGGGGGGGRKRESFISPFEVGKKHTDFLTDYRHTRRMQLEFACRLWY